MIVPEFLSLRKTFVVFDKKKKCRKNGECNNVEILGRKKNTNKIQDRKKIESHELKTLRKSTIMFYR